MTTTTRRRQPSRPLLAAADMPPGTLAPLWAAPRPATPTRLGPPPRPQPMRVVWDGGARRRRHVLRAVAALAVLIAIALSPLGHAAASAAASRIRSVVSAIDGGGTVGATTALDSATQQALVAYDSAGMSFAGLAGGTLGPGVTSWVDPASSGQAVLLVAGSSSSCAAELLVEQSLAVPVMGHASPGTWRVAVPAGRECSAGVMASG